MSVQTVFVRILKQRTLCNSMLYESLFAQWLFI